MARRSNEQIAKILASGGVVEGRAKEEDVRTLLRWIGDN